MITFLNIMLIVFIVLTIIGSVVSATRVGKVRAPLTEQQVGIATFFSLIQLAITVLIIFALNGAFAPLTHG